MLNNDEVATRIAELRSKHIERIAKGAEFCGSLVDKAIDNDRWFTEEFKRSGKCVAGDHFSVDHIDAMAKFFEIDFQTFRRLDIGDAFILEEEWEAEHASPKDIEEFHRLDFLTECELEASKRKNIELIRSVGFNEFFRLKNEEHEKRKNVVR